MENFTPLNTHCEKIWREVLHTNDISLPPVSKSDIVGHELIRWYKFHKVMRHHIRLLQAQEGE